MPARLDVLTLGAPVASRPLRRCSSRRGFGHSILLSVPRASLALPCHHLPRSAASHPLQVFQQAGLQSPIVGSIAVGLTNLGEPHARCCLPTRKRAYMYACIRTHACGASSCTSSRRLVCGAGTTPQRSTCAVCMHVHVHSAVHSAVHPAVLLASCMHAGVTATLPPTPLCSVHPGRRRADGPRRPPPAAADLLCWDGRLPGRLLCCPAAAE